MRVYLKSQNPRIRVIEYHFSRGVVEMTIGRFLSGMNKQVEWCDRNLTGAMSRDVRFKHPITCIIAGSTESGK